MTKRLSTPVKKPTPGIIKDQDLNRTRPLDDQTSRTDTSSTGNYKEASLTRLAMHCNNTAFTPCDLAVSFMHIITEIKPYNTIMAGQVTEHCCSTFKPNLCNICRLGIHNRCTFDMVYLNTVDWSEEEKDLKRILMSLSLLFHTVSDPDLASTMRRTMRTLKISSEEENTEDMSNEEDKVTVKISYNEKYYQASLKHFTFDTDGSDTGGASGPGRGGLRVPEIRRLNMSQLSNITIVHPLNLIDQKYIHKENVIISKDSFLMCNLYPYYFYLKIINTNDVSKIQTFTTEIYDHYIVEVVNPAVLKPSQRRVQTSHFPELRHKDRSNLMTRNLMCKSSWIRNQSKPVTPTQALDLLTQPILNSSRSMKETFSNS